jgi:hypothetical protein
MVLPSLDLLLSSLVLMAPICTPSPSLPPPALCLPAPALQARLLVSCCIALLFTHCWPFVSCGVYVAWELCP